MEVPESVSLGLASIKPRLHARWNPQGKVLDGRSFDANGKPRHRTYEGLWELWDVDESGNTYRVCQLIGPDGGFIPLGDWVVDLVRLINPERVGGDMHRLVGELVDRPNEDVARLADWAFEDLLDYLADRCWTEKTQRSRIVVPRAIVRV